jgi:hypothetical protein
VSFDEEDPEVIADLKLRAYTERDRSRSREMPTYVPAKIIGQVPCRGRCGALVEWPEDAEERFAIFNRILASKAEAPLDKTRIAFCSRCVARGREGAADANRKGVEGMARLIRELRSDPGPNFEREKEILEKLKPHHPDLTGLVEAIRIRRLSKPATRARRSSL